MSWHAVRAASEAAAAAREFLLLAERGRWLRLCALALVVGVGWLVPAAARVASLPGVAPGTAGDALAAVAVGLAVLLAVGADAYGRFALLSGLRSGRLSLTEDVRWRLSRSVRWLGFAFGAGVLAFAAAGTALLSVRAGWLAVTGGDPTSAVGVALTVGAVGVAAAVVVGVAGFAHATLSLLPATMLATGVGALASWRRLWRAFAGRRSGFLGYLLTRGLVGLVVTTTGLLVAGALALGLALVAFVVLVGVFGTVSAAVETVGAVPFGVAATAAVVAFAVLPVRAVAVTALTSYELAVLGGVDPDLALLDVAGADGLDEDDAVSVILPDGTEAGLGAADDGLGPADPGADGSDAGSETGAFQFDAVETEEE